MTDPVKSSSRYQADYDRAMSRRTGRRYWRSMVRWFDPRLLLRTLFALIVARLFAAYADRRERDQGRPPDGPWRYDDKDELWLDYVADLGDGWDSTATIAGLIAEPLLEMGGRALPHARVLLMGGDQAYPVASRDEYLCRLEAPYYSLHPESPAQAPRDLFVLPGNHDWYDGLAAFSRLFLQQRWFAGWRTRQTRSYFVLRLPQRWWLVAVDVQLDNDIDAAQLHYLLHATEGLAAGDAVILMSATPFWLDPRGSTLRRNLAFLQRRLVEERGAEVRLSLSGDLHHYARYTHQENGAERITAGGGGAFLHGTAWLPEAQPEDADMLDPQPEGNAADEKQPWRLRKTFPRPEQSRLMLWRLFLFPAFNPSLALFLGAVSALLLWGADAASHGLFFASAGGGVWYAAGALLSAVPASPMLAAALAGWFAAFVAFADPPIRAGASSAGGWKTAFGLLHGLLHLWLALSALVWLEPSRLVPLFGFLTELASLALVLALGSGLLFGVWIWLLYQLFGCHRETAFSACRIRDWKNFLRLHIDGAGVLSVHVIAVERVCRRWQERKPAVRGEAVVEPADGIALARRARLLERIVVTAGKTTD